MRSLPDPVGDLEPVEWNQHKHEWKHLSTIVFPDLLETKVHVLIGATHAHAMTGPDVSGEPGEPVARKTFFGWCTLGFVHNDNQLNKDVAEREIEVKFSRIRQQTRGQIEIS